VNIPPHAFATPWGLWLLAALPALAVVGAVGWWRRRRALARLGRMPALAGLTSVHPALRMLRGACRSTGLTLLILAIAGPQWGRDWDQATAPGRDLVVVLDMSRSMLADDVLGQSSPNRLGRAKDALFDLADTVQRRGGHRLGLVVFAARARVACPLTHDYDHFRDALAQADPTDPRIAPEVGAEAPASGTRMGEALSKAVEIHDPAAQGYQDILMISDGDDPARDNEWHEKGVTAARDHKIPVNTLGVGDAAKGGRIPFKNGYLHYDGQVVWTRLQEKPLEEIAKRTGGVYTSAGTKELRLGPLFLEQIEPRGGRETREDVVARYQQHSPWFFGPALALLAAEMSLGHVRWRRARRPAPGAGEPALT
jgi:Ca-activated chloride channel family protein